MILICFLFMAMQCGDRRKLGGTAFQEANIIISPSPVLLINDSIHFTMFSEVESHLGFQNYQLEMTLMLVSGTEFQKLDSIAFRHNIRSKTAKQSISISVAQPVNIDLKNGKGELMISGKIENLKRGSYWPYDSYPLTMVFSDSLQMQQFKKGEKK